MKSKFVKCAGQIAQFPGAFLALSIYAVLILTGMKRERDGRAKNILMSAIPPASWVLWLFLFTWLGLKFAGKI